MSDQSSEKKLSSIQTVCPRFRDESERAYNCFLDYVFYNCNYMELYKIYTQPNIYSRGVPPTKSLSTIQSWSNKYGWITRRENWLTYELKKREESMLLYWEAHRDRIIKNSSSLLDKAEQMLKHPIVKSVAQDGENLIVIEPSKWTFRDVAAFMDISTKLTKEAVGDEVWAKELLRRKGYHVFEPGMGDVSMALNSLVSAKIIPSEIVPRIIDAIKESEVIMGQKIQTAFDMVKEEYYNEGQDSDDEIENEETQNEETSGNSSELFNVAKSVNEARKKIDDANSDDTENNDQINY